MDCQYRNDMPPDEFSIGRLKACIFKIIGDQSRPALAQANEDQFTVYGKLTKDHGIQAD